MKIKKHIIPRLNRYNWFAFTVVNPLRFEEPEEIDKRAVELLSDQYKALWDGGNKKAIFAFMKASRSAYRASWVLDQIEKWHVEASPSSKKNILELAKCYSGTKGYKTSKETLERIKRDIEIFRSILKSKKTDKSRKQRDDVFPEMASKFHISTSEIKKIWDCYRKIMDAQKNECQIMRDAIDWTNWPSKQRINSESEPEKTFLKFYPNYVYSDKGFTSYLQECLKNLRNYLQ